MIDLDSGTINIAEVDQFMNKYNSHFDFSGGALTISNDNSEFSTRLSDTKLSFIQSGQEIAYISGYKLYIKDTRVSGGLEIESSTGGSYIRHFVDSSGTYIIMLMES